MTPELYAVSNGEDDTTAAGSVTGVLREGDVDAHFGKKVHTLIFSSSDSFVYLDDEYYAWWHTKSPSLLQGAGAVVSFVSLLEAIPTDCLRPDRVLAFRRMVGEGLARLFDGSGPAQAMEQLRVAEAWVKARNAEVARMWYLKASGIAGCLTGAAAIALWLAREDAGAMFGNAAFQVCLGGAIGGVGAMLSVLSRSRQLELDPIAGKEIHYLEGIARIVAGFVGACLFALALRADLLMGFVAESTRSLSLLLTLCFVAGASERLVSGFIEKIDVTAAKPGASE